MKRLDIGIASYGASEKLARAVASIREMSSGDFRLFVIDNPGPDPATRRMIAELAVADDRIVPVFLERNVGYAGAVNEFLRLALTEPGWSHLAYCDNDVVIRTPGWDPMLCAHLDRHPQIGMIFPNGGAYPIPRADFIEVMWGIGFCWVASRKALTEVGPFDAELGHQEEADYCLRLRMAGYVCAAAPEVQVQHEARSTNDPASRERINAGVVRFVDKWNRYFCGGTQGYHSPNVLRWEDWPPNALYLEDYWRRHPKTQGLNDAPEEIAIDGMAYDLIRVPRFRHYYRGRVI